MLSRQPRSSPVVAGPLSETEKKLKQNEDDMAALAALLATVRAFSSIFFFPFNLFYFISPFFFSFVGVH